MCYLIEKRSLVIFALLCSISGVHATENGDAVNGERLYDRLCSACHSIEINKIGPKHQDTFGQRVGSVPDFNYSQALSSSKLRWNEQLLNKWLSNPEATIPGQMMFFSVDDDANRIDIIAYLKKVSRQD